MDTIAQCNYKFKSSDFLPISQQHANIAHQTNRWEERKSIKLLETRIESVLGVIRGLMNMNVGTNSATGVRLPACVRQTTDLLYDLMQIGYIVP